MQASLQDKMHSHTAFCYGFHNTHLTSIFIITKNFTISYPQKNKSEEQRAITHPLCAHPYSTDGGCFCDQNVFNLHGSGWLFHGIGFREIGLNGFHIELDLVFISY